MLEIKKILAPTDCSESSREAITLAVDLAEKFESELTLLIVTDERFLRGMKSAYFPKDIHDDVYQSTAEHAKTTLEEFWKTFDRDYRRVKFANAFGNPFTQIVKFSNSDQFELIVIGSHGRTDLSYVLMGSCAEAVVRHSKIPVMVVKHRTHKFQSVHDE